MKNSAAYVSALGLTVGVLLSLGCSAASDGGSPVVHTENATGGASQSGIDAGAQPSGSGGTSSTGGAGNAGNWPGAGGATSPGGAGGSSDSGGSSGTGGSSSAGGSSSIGGSGGAPPGSGGTGGPDPDCSTGILNDQACCAASCGTCGGSGCSQLPGGADACCKNAILNSGVSCSTSGPPCVVSGNSGTGGAPNTGGAGGSSNTGGTGGSSNTGGTGGASTNPCDNPSLVWKSANKTNYESYPAPGSDECVNYNGCTWAGEFAYCDDKKPESWVQAHNIVSVFPSNGLVRHDLCLKSGSNTIVVTAIDTCGDSDCNGCCTENRGTADRLIDIEKYTDQRWGVDDGPIQWADLGENPTACD